MLPSLGSCHPLCLECLFYLLSQGSKGPFELKHHLLSEAFQPFLSPTPTPKQSLPLSEPQYLCHFNDRNDYFLPTPTLDCELLGAQGLFPTHFGL